MSNKEEINVKQKISNFKEDFKNLNSLSEKVYTSPGFKYTNSDGKVYTKSDLKKFYLMLSREFDEIVKMSSKNQSKKGTKTKKNNTNNPMFAPKYITQELVDYFNTLDLGHAYSQNDEGVFEDKGNIKKYLNLLFKDRLTTCASLTPLFCIVIKLNKLQDPGNAQFIIPDKSFNEHFGDIFVEMEKESEEQEKLLKKKLSSASAEEKFLIEKELEENLDKRVNPKRLRSVRFQTVVSKNTDKNLTSKQKDFIKDEKIIKQIKDEQKIISSTLAYYRQKSKNEKK